MASQAKTAERTTEPDQSDFDRFMTKEITFVPRGETDAITLTPGRVRHSLCSPTRAGHWPSEADLTNFLMMCRSKGLNPYVGDAFLIGYDDQQLGPQFSLITSVQALRKRADEHPMHDGTEYGIVVELKDGTRVDREGCIKESGDKLVGGWARVWRKDKKFPAVGRVELHTYNTGRSRWKKDPEGMIAKVAEGGGYRRGFPKELGDMHTEADFGAEFKEDSMTDTERLQRIQEQRGERTEYTPSGDIPRTEHDERLRESFMGDHRRTQEERAAEQANPECICGDGEANADCPQHGMEAGTLFPTGPDAGDA